MSNARDNIKAEMAAEAQYIAKTTRIDLAAFLALQGEARARRWRQWPVSAKQDAVIQQLSALGYGWDNATVDHWVAKYDDKYTAGPVELAVEGALERLALEHASTARLADRLGDKAHRKAERAAATAFTNALVQYKAGIRPQLLDSGAWLLPSRRAGEAPHIVRMDGDWVCSCCAGAAMHWPIALICGIEQAFEDMQQYDDGNCDPPDEPSPLGPDEGDSIPSARHIGQRLAEARRVYLVAA